MTLADDLATLRWAIDEHPTLKASPTAVAALARVEAEIARLRELVELHEALNLIASWRERAEAAEAASDEYERQANRTLDRAVAAEAEVARLRDGLRPIVREYDLWAEDANDGEFRLWDLDRLVVAIVAARALLAEDGAVEGCEYHRPLLVNGCRACEARAEDGAKKRAWAEREEALDRLAEDGAATERDASGGGRWRG